MHRLARILLSIFLLLTLTTCSKDDGPVGPGGSSGTPVSLTGTARFPSTSGIDLKKITVELGDESSPLDSAKGFKLTGQEGISGLVWVTGPDSIPLLLAPLSHPESAGNITLDASSTALALVYIHPLVCGGTADEADAVLTRLRALPQLRTLETLLAQKLGSNPRALAVEDNALSTAIGDVVVAYLNGIQYPTLSKALKKTGTTSADIITVSPTTPVSGHELKYLGGETFSLSNAYGRWAYAVTPTNQFFLSPNGSLLDVVRDKLPWAPSVKEFNETLPKSADSIAITVYGLGWKNDPTNVWDNLTPLEQAYAMRAGFSTVMFELIPHMLACYTTTAHLHAAPEKTQTAMMKALQHVFNDTRTYDRCILYVRNGDYTGLMWFLAKWTFGKIVNDEKFRADYLPEFLLNLSAGKLAKLGKGLHIALQAVVASEALTSMGKTFFGMQTARFKTPFKVYRIIQDFGSIAGTVHDKENGTPIAGAIVNLKGDDNNPMNPPHQATTGVDGGFLFQNIQAGPKTVEASKSGYSTASVSVTVTKGGTASVGIELTKEAGRLTGTVLNDIYRKNNISPANFKGESNLEVIDLSGATATSSFWVYDGTYSLNLPAATYKVIAWHEDYRPDTVQVTVQKNTTTSAPDLVLEPLGYIRGEVRIDINMDGSDEYRYSYSDSVIACFTANDFASCSNGAPVVWIGKWPPIVGLDAVSLIINPAVVQQTGTFNLGGLDVVACPPYTAAASMNFATTRVFCSDPSIGASGPLSFTILSGGSSNACNCGIADPGRLILEEYGTELGSRIKGTFNGMMAGWKKCDCDGGATSNCATAYVSVTFQALLGDK